MTRLWQSMLRASEVGRFRQCVKTATVGVAEKESITHDTDFAPNPVCTAVALAIVQQVFQASGLSLVLTNLLMGILGNAIYTEYIPDETPSIPPVVPSYQPYSNLAHSLQQQLQTVQTEFNNVKYSTNPLDQERLALMTGVRLKSFKIFFNSLVLFFQKDFRIHGCDAAFSTYCRSNTTVSRRRTIGITMECNGKRYTFAAY